VIASCVTVHLYIGRYVYSLRPCYNKDKTHVDLVVSPGISRVDQLIKYKSYQDSVALLFRYMNDT